jgi:hypothetical protein
MVYFSMQELIAAVVPNGKFKSLAQPGIVGLKS